MIPAERPGRSPATIAPSGPYDLLYRRLGLPPGDENEAEPQSLPTGSQEVTEPVRRQAFAGLTGTWPPWPRRASAGTPEQFASRIGAPR